jgi:hypothetical protein
MRPANRRGWLDSYDRGPAAVKVPPEHSLHALRALQICPLWAGARCPTTVAIAAQIGGSSRGGRGKSVTLCDHRRARIHMRVRTAGGRGAVRGRYILWRRAPDCISRLLDVRSLRRTSSRQDRTFPGILIGGAGALLSARRSPWKGRCGRRGQPGPNPPARPARGWRGVSAPPAPRT